VSSDRDDRTGVQAGRSVALFIDWDNFAIGLREEMPDRPADVGPVLRWARRLGVLTVCRAYGDWRDVNERLALYNAGVEVVYAPVLPLGGSVMARNGGGAKSLADTEMAVDVTDLLNLMPGISSLVLVTSDKDLIPVLRFAQRRGLYAAVVGSDRTASALRDLADQFVSYRQLLDLEGAPAILSRPMTVPPVRYPRGFRPALPTPSHEPYGRQPGRTSPLPPVSTGIGGATPGAVLSPAPTAPRSRPAPPVEVEDAEAETVSTSSTRRRRRGGRRRRGHEVVGEVQPDVDIDASADEEIAAEGEPEEEPTPVDEGVAAELTEPVTQEVLTPIPATEAPEDERAEPVPSEAIAGTPTEEVAVEVPIEVIAAQPGEPEQMAAAVEPEPAPPPPVPSPRRTPTILPGEKIRRLAAVAQPVETEAPPAMTEPLPASLEDRPVNEVAPLPAEPPQSTEAVIPPDAEVPRTSEVAEDAPMATPEMQAPEVIQTGAPETEVAEDAPMATPEMQAPESEAADDTQPEGAGRSRRRSRRRTGGQEGQVAAISPAPAEGEEVTEAVVEQPAEHGGEDAPSEQADESDASGRPAARGRSRRRGSRSR
jgi:hypothetical protein